MNTTTTTKKLIDNWKAIKKNRRTKVGRSHNYATHSPTWLNCNKQYHSINFELHYTVPRSFQPSILALAPPPHTRIIFHHFYPFEDPGTRAKSIAKHGDCMYEVPSASSSHSSSGAMLENSSSLWHFVPVETNREYTRLSSPFGHTVLYLQRTVRTWWRRCNINRNPP